MKKVLGTIFVTAVALVLAAYSGMRSLDFISLTLPPEQQAGGWLALVATEGGIFCWLIYYLHGASGPWQKGIGLIMCLIDLAGSIALFTADTLLQTGNAGLTQAMTPDEIRSIVLGLSGLIALNVAATVVCHLFDPDHRKRGAEEEAFDAVEEAALKQVTANADKLAAELAPLLAADWVRDTRARYTAKIGSGAIPSAANIVDAKSREIAPRPAQARPAQALPNAGWAPKRERPARAYQAETVAPAMATAQAERPTQAQTVDPALLAAILAALAAQATQPKGDETAPLA